MIIIEGRLPKEESTSNYPKLRQRMLAKFGTASIPVETWMQWSKFRIVKSPNHIAKIPRTQITPYRWYHRAFRKVKDFFAPDYSPIKIKALRAWYNPEKLAAAHEFASYLDKRCTL